MDMLEETLNYEAAVRYLFGIGHDVYILKACHDIDLSGWSCWNECL